MFGALMVVLGGVLTALSTFAPSLGDWEISGQNVEELDWKNRLLIPVVPILGILLCTFTWAISRRRAWSRNLLMGFWLVMIGFLVSSSLLAPAPFGIRDLTNLAVVLPMALGSWWYLYRNPSVMAYFKELSSVRAE